MAAASLPLEEFDEKFLTCPVCQEIYDDPRVLPCLHTFCARCLETWRREKGQLTCPTCRHQVRLQGTGVSNLSPNFYINSLLDFRVLHKSEEDHTQCQMCKSDAKVEGRCADCSILLCKNCITAHSSIPALKDHYIFTLNDLKNPSSRPKYSRAMYCPRHTDQRMTFYCQPCAKLVCRDCTITEHRPGPNHNPQEVSKIAQKYKAELQTLVKKNKDTGDALKKAKATVSQELASITTNCQTRRKEIQEHFAQMRAKLDKEEKTITEKLNKMEKTQKEPLEKEEKELEENIKSTKDGLKFSTDILARGNDVEILTLRQQLEDRLNVLSTTQVHHEALKNNISFQPDNACTDLVDCYLFLSDESLFLAEAPVESLPTIVIFRPQKGQEWETDPQVTVTSPGGQCAKLDTTRTSGGAFKAVWRPQASGEHVVGIISGEGVGVTGGISLCSPLIVEVGSNNPVLRFGHKGSQHGQFNTPFDLAVSGDRLYVADTRNTRIQVFDLTGNFCYSFGTATGPVSIAAHMDGTAVILSGDVVKKFTPSGELLHKFSVDGFCTNSYGLAVQRDGRVVVTDPDKHVIFLFEVDGNLVKQVGGKGQGERQFDQPYFVCADTKDNIIVSDQDNDRVQVFDKNMNFHHKFGKWGQQPQDMYNPIGVSADSRGNIVLANIGGTIGGIEHGKKLQVFRLDGTWVSTISSDGDKLNIPYGVAVTEDGHVFVADPGDHCIRKYRYM
ncbi:tripartite motif-containing protein 2-like [Branchiostoma lanceolatum]|uniref:tripartite motif-containing protein 2-like n=1 Tax=Branchiostoma lanceolatum TaxID=7740 RepID=UPI00345523AC